VTTTGTPARGRPGSAAQRDRRRRMLDATVELASQGGFDAVQMRAVADRADVALGTLYNYFPSKIHLLVSALGRELERGLASTAGTPVPGETAHERVMNALVGSTMFMRRDANLTEALTRAFMFADASVAAEIHRVGRLLTDQLTAAMGTEPDQEPTTEQEAIARVIVDVCISALMGWVTGRTPAEEVDRHVDVAVGLLLRD